jgi:hypothetical protein
MENMSLDILWKTESLQCVASQHRRKAKIRVRCISILLRLLMSTGYITVQTLKIMFASELQEHGRLNITACGVSPNLSVHYHRFSVRHHVRDPASYTGRPKVDYK